MLKVKSRNTRTRCETCSKLTIKIPERHQWPMNIFQWSTRCHAFNVTKTEAPAQVFSCEFCNIFKNTYFVEHLQMASANGSY